MPELIHSELSDSDNRRLTRLLSDILALRKTLTRGQIRTAYENLEAARDAISALLDRVDGKNA
jgi:hypothetical protein